MNTLSPRGFTLLEVLITVAIIGILSMLAMGSYQGYMQRSHRVSAQSTMMDFTQRLERYYTDENTYEGFDLGVERDRILNGGGEAMYSLTLEIQDDGQGYVLTATPENTQADDECGILIIDQVGRRLPTLPGCW